MSNQYKGYDPVLSKASIGYKNSAYIASLILPSLSVKHQAGKHYIYDQGRFRLQDTRRASGANSNEVSLKITTGNPYLCEDHALKQFVTDEDRDNAETPMSPMLDATENVTELLMIDKEKEAADLLTATATMTQNATLSGTDQWSDPTNSDPIGDLELGMATVHSAIGINPNTVVLGKQVWDKIKHHPDFLERIKYSQKGIVATDLLAALIGVERVIIGAAAYNSATEGQTDARSYIWGKDVVMAYVNPRVAPKMMTLGHTYQWLGKTRITQKLRGTDEEDRSGTFVRVGNDYYDEKIVSVGAGYLIKDAVA